MDYSMEQSKASNRLIWSRYKILQHFFILITDQVTMSESYFYN